MLCEEDRYSLGRTSDQVYLNKGTHVRSGIPKQEAKRICNKNLAKKLE